MISITILEYYGPFCMVRRWSNQYYPNNLSIMYYYLLVCCGSGIIWEKVKTGKQFKYIMRKTKGKELSKL